MCWFSKPRPTPEPPSAGRLALPVTRSPPMFPANTTSASTEGQFVSLLVAYCDHSPSLHLYSESVRALLPVFNKSISLMSVNWHSQNFSRGMPYMAMLSAANLTTLASRREEMSRKFFLHISQPTSCLHHLLPDPRDHSVISRLRTYEKILECSLALNVTAPLFSMR